MALDLDLFDFSPDAFVTDGAVPAQIERAEATAADNARRRALELQAQACNNAADACWYLACSLGAARDLPPGEGEHGTALSTDRCPGRPARRDRLSRAARSGRRPRRRHRRALPPT